jgi:hypothetical protein
VKELGQEKEGILFIQLLKQLERSGDDLLLLFFPADGGLIVARLGTVPAKLGVVPAFNGGPVRVGWQQRARGIDFVRFCQTISRAKDRASWELAAPQIVAGCRIGCPQDQAAHRLRVGPGIIGSHRAAQRVTTDSPALDARESGHHLGRAPRRKDSQIQGHGHDDNQVALLSESASGRRIGSWVHSPARIEDQDCGRHITCGLEDQPGLGLYQDRIIGLQRSQCLGHGAGGCPDHKSDQRQQWQQKQKKQQPPSFCSTHNLDATVAVLRPDQATCPELAVLPNAKP